MLRFFGSKLTRVSRVGRVSQCDDGVKETNIHIDRAGQRGLGNSAEFFEELIDCPVVLWSTELHLEGEGLARRGEGGRNIMDWSDECKLDASNERISKDRLEIIAGPDGRVIDNRVQMRGKRVRVLEDANEFHDAILFSVGQNLDLPHLLIRRNRNSAEHAKRNDGSGLELLQSIVQDHVRSRSVEGRETNRDWCFFSSGSDKRVALRKIVHRDEVEHSVVAWNKSQVLNLGWSCIRALRAVLGQNETHISNVQCQLARVADGDNRCDCGRDGIKLHANDILHGDVFESLQARQGCLDIEFDVP